MRIQRILQRVGRGRRAEGPPRREVPECIVLPAPASDVPPVRIFLGTEPGQWRAERVFLWSILEHRDPARRYEIHRMERLEGFDERGWTTGFTNYRFAIPHFAGGRGRAIYNDVDQIYRADPAELFDLDLGDHGFLALSDRELSVLLIDGQRMADLWTLDEARREDKKTLQRRTAARPGLRGDLPATWNARDGEADPETAKLVHYTTLHTQPWRPFPERYAYREGHGAELWKAAEARADAAGFEGFDADRPSAAMAALRERGEGLTRSAPEDAEMLRMLARLTPGDRVLELEDVHLLRWLFAASPEAQDGLLVPAGIEDLPETDQGWALRRLFGHAHRFLFVAASPGKATPRFVERFLRIADLHEDVHWELFVRDGSRVRHFEGGHFLGRGDPRTWLIVDERAGNETQAIGLAQALGWSYEHHRLRFGRWAELHPRLRGATRLGLARSERLRLQPPWPDLVISAGRRAAPIARWVRERAQGRTRLVHLGRKGGAAARLFDLVVTPAHARLWPHPHRIETLLPLSRVDDAELARAAERFKDTFEADPATPRLGVLVGGETSKFRFGVAEARRLVRDVEALSQRLGASVWVTTSPRTGVAATEAVGRELAPGSHFFPWSAEGPETPYLGLLALCDLLVVTGESESMLAEACASDLPVLLYPLPPARGGVGLGGRLVDRLLARASAERPNERGTARPQRGLSRLAARWVDEGFVRPTRDLSRLHRELIESGRVQPFGELPDLDRMEPHREARRVAARVRRLMGVEADDAIGIEEVSIDAERPAEAEPGARSREP